MGDMILYGIPMVAVIIGLVELAKGSLGMPSRWAAPLALGLGILFAVLGWLEVGADASLLEAVLLGILTGLSASGLYSGGKAVTGR